METSCLPDLPLFLLPSTRDPREANTVTHHDRDARSMMRRESKDTVSALERLTEPWELPFSSHSLDEQSDDDELSCDAPPHWAPKTKRRHIDPRLPQAKTLA
ncbi:hypothetical protein AB1Y20_014154 [Prymnesium parvum]|uniref:Uncharacterized protein n=1 Tax=Prymnesium parvum TaxID=97485 RepID=A0AB34IGX4_PRYPA